MRIRTIVGIAMGAFAFGIGSVTAFRLPEDSLVSMAAMSLTAIILIIVMIVVMGIMGWTMVNVIRGREDANMGRPQQPAYPPVMIVGQPAQPMLPPPERNGYDTIPSGPRTFTVIGEGADEDE